MARIDLGVYCCGQDRLGGGREPRLGQARDRAPRLGQARGLGAAAT